MSKGQYHHDSFNDYDGGGFVRRVYTLNPHVKSTFGPLYIEAEGWFGFGDWQDYRNSRVDIDLDAWALYANAKYILGPFYLGALFSYESGNDPSTPNEQEGGVMQTLWLEKN